MFDGVEEGVDVWLFAADEPDSELTWVFAVFVVFSVLPGENPVDKKAIDGDVFFVGIDRRHNGYLDFGVWWLVAENVDQFVNSHGCSLPVTGCCVLVEVVAEPHRSVLEKIQADVLAPIEGGGDSVILIHVNVGQVDRHFGDD